MADETAPAPSAAASATTAMTAMTAMTATTARIEVAGALDALALLEGDGVLFAQPDGFLVGSAHGRRLHLPDGPPADVAAFVATELRALASPDGPPTPGRGPVAFGALPFRGGPAEMVIPDVVIGTDSAGDAWITTIGPGGARPEPTPTTTDASAGLDLPSSFTVTPTCDPAEWCNIVARGRDQVRSGTLDKVVLAREVVVRTQQPISRQAVLHRLRDAYPACMVFAIGGFVGASPELLVARDGARVRSHPLAGTAPRSADPDTDRRLADELRASTKNQTEHRITIDMVHDTLLPFCSYLDEEAEPSIVPMANVQHLGTMVEGHLSSPPPSVLELALQLHPTPAVGGWPRAEALAVIDELEGLDRGRYAGPVGWVDAHGNGAWAVGIRSAELAPDLLSARVFAGVGVVAGSDPLLELAETRAKFQAMLSAIIRP